MTPRVTDAIAETVATRIRKTMPHVSEEAVALALPHWKRTMAAADLKARKTERPLAPQLDWIPWGKWLYTADLAYGVTLVVKRTRKWKNDPKPWRFSGFGNPSLSDQWYPDAESAQKAAADVATHVIRSLAKRLMKPVPITRKK